MKKGSALLIVLGMLAFMVISAVAFSAYMRASRLPSSYLRRASSSRLLAKAALAEAIDEIDRSIGENIHPNIGRQVSRKKSNDNATTQICNTWAHRVYLGTENAINLPKPESTVSTLTFEGLAYIPPPLVNYARYYSRRSQAGKWRSLGFDAGRYAFCALDVSDYFDVNALAANAGRSSSALGRITLAHLCENRAHTSYETEPNVWDDTFMLNFREKSPLKAAIEGSGGASASSSKVPLVSVADLNLAINEKKPGKFTSPFCEYVLGDWKSFYNGIGRESDDGDRLARMTLVTDAYYPSTGGSGTDDDYDLADPKNQPWNAGVLQGGPAGGATLGDAMNNLTPAGLRIRNRIGGLGMAELYDYVDENNVPVSLSIPQTERTPMIAGFKLDNMGNVSVKINKTVEPNNYSSACMSDNYPNLVSGVNTAGPGAQRVIRHQEIYKLDGQALSAAFMGQVKTLVTYPYHRGPDVLSPDSFTLDGHLALFLTTGDFRFRTQNADESNLLRMTKDGDKLGTSVQLPNRGVFHAPLPQTALNISSLVNNSDETKAALPPVTLAAEAAQAVYDALDQNALLTVTWDEQQTAAQDPNTGKWNWNTPSGRTLYETVCGVPPITPSGMTDANFANAGTLRGWIENGSQEVTVRAAVWLRIKNGDGVTVDMVPACLNDDKEFLCVDNNNSMGPAGSDDLGSAYPVMFFTGGSFNFSLDSSVQNNLESLSTTPLALDFAARDGLKGVVCPDPRWNWAPENWYAVADVSEGDWLTAVKDVRNEAGRDQDVFMMSSDAGYLQSIYELAFLPRTTDWNDKLTQHNYGDYSMGTVVSPNDGRKEWGVTKTDVRNLAHMWRTYCPYDRHVPVDCPRDDFTVNGDPWFVNEGGGCKVNPYSDNIDVLMAAFANTPFDWWAASTNVNGEASIQQSERLNAKSFNQKYAFNEMNSNAKIKWQDLQLIALNFISKIHGNEAAVAAAGGLVGIDPSALATGGGSGLRNGTDTDVNAWEEKWDELDWDGQNSVFCGVQTSPELEALSDVDRKFLYGYWRDCFAPRQQLFLVFVRAEPMMMGGSDRMPPQLGARAVALVWRDPLPSGDQNKPHRTRVLFYRQFD